MNTRSHSASSCTPQNLDSICYRRIKSKDFAQKPTLLQRIHQFFLGM